MHPKIVEIKERQLNEYADEIIVGLTEHLGAKGDGKHLFVAVAVFDNRLGKVEFRSTMTEEDTASIYKGYVNRMAL